MRWPHDQGRSATTSRSMVWMLACSARRWRCAGAWGATGGHRPGRRFARCAPRAVEDAVVGVAVQQAVTHGSAHGDFQRHQRLLQHQIQQLAGQPRSGLAARAGGAQLGRLERLLQRHAQGLVAELAAPPAPGLGATPEARVTICWTQRPGTKLRICSASAGASARPAPAVPACRRTASRHQQGSAVRRAGREPDGIPCPDAGRRRRAIDSNSRAQTAHSSHPSWAQNSNHAYAVGWAMALTRGLAGAGRLGVLGPAPAGRSGRRRLFAAHLGAHGPTGLSVYFQGEQALGIYLQACCATWRAPAPGLPGCVRCPGPGS